MYLKSIKAQGFKSFADKLDLEIKDGITAIVGPNGSGKSNIVDAVRWVMGEQSIKSLRGTDNMTDVIFSGSKDRDAQTRAMVALTFDNTDHYFNSDYTEIEIKRMVYKTGENEYFINNSKVRLKDITNLFIDSGAGNESFNIISQGNVADVVNSKPESRRSIFEEAAGVLKYKKRKEESLRKLDKTKENLLRIKLVIDELSSTVEPLKEQSEIAKEYLKYKEELKDVEISLIVNDITSIYNDYQIIKDEIENLEKELLDKESKNNTDSLNIETIKNEITKLDDIINEKNMKLISLNSEIAKLNADKQMMIERQKYDFDKNKVNDVIIKLKEESLSYDKEIKVLSNDIENLKNQSKSYIKEKQELDNDLINIKLNHSTLNSKINNVVKSIFEKENKITILENNINSNAKLPYAVQAILNNHRFKNIYGTIGQLISVEDKYSIALDVVLGTNAQFLVTKDDKEVKEVIDFLKENKLGRATFFPLNIIKPRYIDNSLIERLMEVNGFINTLNNLVDCDDLYRPVIDNQLGNVIVASDIDSMNLIGRIVDHKYRIVTLDGEVLHAGGSITGGTLKKNSSLFDKNELDKLKYELNIDRNNESNYNSEIKNIISEEDIINNNIEEVSKKIFSINEIINQKESILEDLNNKYQEIIKSINAQESILNNNIDDKLSKILDDVNKSITDKEILESDINSLKNDRLDKSSKLLDLENFIKTQNSEYNKISNDLNQRKIKISKYDVKLDNLLLNLSENYELSYEKAKLMYHLDIEEDEARSTVLKLKHNISKLGDVNVGAISEYERLGERYNFLNNQQSDLEKASEELLNVISDMDKIMIDKFTETFEKISNEFSIVFKKLFKGGKGILKLTDPDNILSTGIDIIAEPPGKKLNSIALLSGGEKTLTAIALLFSILNVKTVPFVILDEAEAALDDANVDTFGEYIEEKKKNSQFILITHKKRTMEYADVLYGITMQESGVSKVVSVKLEDK